MSNQITVKDFFSKDVAKRKMAELLGDRAVQFTTSVLQIVASNQSLSKADPQSIFNSACMAATLDLPINQNLGFAYIVPYNDKNKGVVAQFQMGYKGFKQLAQRSGQFKLMTDSDVREGEIVNYNRLTGEIRFDWIQTEERLKRRVVGYVSFFRLNNGFESTLYMTLEEVEAHAKKYSQNYKKWGTGLWKDEFDLMARKTVTKLNLSRNAPLSVDLQKAVIADQSVITSDRVEQDNIEDIVYVDNGEELVVVEDLEILFDTVSEDLPEEDKKEVERIIKDKIEVEYQKALGLLKKVMDTPKEAEVIVKKDKMEKKSEQTKINLP